MTYPKGRTGNLPLCPLIFSCIRFLYLVNICMTDAYSIKILNIFVKPFEVLSFLAFALSYRLQG